MPVGGGAHRQSLIMLDGFLHVLSIVLVNVMMRSNWLLEIIIHHLTRALRARTAQEHHDTTSGIGV